MKCLKEIDHIGYAVHDIQKTAQYYVDGGWNLSEIYDENIQNTKIAFLTKVGMPTIELVSPLDGGSPVDNVLKHSGVAPYHICYVVDDMMEAVEELYEEGFKPLFMPVKSVAMDNREICYLYHLELGVIELVSRN
jgi:methylmalonyl-CoA/ethylmalonyl-CoA epimerase